jgi:Xaa-Pro aminopeptidase
MRNEVVERQRAAMDEAGLDAIVSTSPENFAYTSGFVVPSQSLMRWRHAAAVVTHDGGEALFCVDMEESTVRSHAGDTEVRAWAEFSDDAMAVLGDLLDDMGLEAGRIGIELDHLPAGDFARIERRMPMARFVGVEGILARLRQSKTADEVDLLRRLSRIADKALADAFAAVRAGDTEMDMAAALTRSVYEQGAERIAIMIVATGPRSELPNVGPTDRILEADDVCRLEVFPVIGGYHAGVCRTGVIGHAPPEAERIWANLVACREMLLGMIGPGVETRAVYSAFLDMFGALGLPPISFVGHGIGLHLHEDPYLSDSDKGTLEPGMVLGVEPLVYRTGHGFGLQFKDMIAVTEHGCDLLSDVTANDKLIVAG